MDQTRLCAIVEALFDEMSNFVPNKITDRHRLIEQLCISDKITSEEMNEVLSMPLSKLFALCDGETPNIQFMSAQQFDDLGYLMEVNRLALHPLGLSLTVQKDDLGNVCFGAIVDARDDPEGLMYEPFTPDKIALLQRIQKERAAKTPIRMQKLDGHCVQQIDQLNER